MIRSHRSRWLKTATHRTADRGFTLVELLIVATILGILAVIAMPKLCNQTEDAKQAALDTNLVIMATAIEIYKLEHNDTYPGTISSESNWQNFVTHMTTQTDRFGKPGTRYGPYLRTGIP